MGMERVTVYDIAREANVSVSTVSRVLNGTAPVKSSTRRKVLELLDKYKFQPNALARSLSSKRSGTIGVILPDIQNMFFPEVFRGAEDSARELDYTLFLCNTSGIYEKESEYMRLLQEKQVDGIIFMGGRVNLARCARPLAEEMAELSERIPIVIVNGKVSRTPCYRIQTDESAGAKMLVEHLISLGHKEIGFLGGDAQTSTTAEKLKAFRQTLEENGLSYRQEWVLHGDFSLQCGRILMDRFLSMRQRPTAVFCINDYTAIGAIKCALAKGFRIPDDVAITGFDDTQLASAVTPELTTISQNSHRLGQLAVEMLYKVIHKEKARKVTTLEPRLIVRDSTAPSGTSGDRPRSM